jgi:hypothetical protein
MHTETELKAMDAVTLRQVAKGLKVNPSGMKGPDIIRAILKAQSGATPADPDAKKKRVTTAPAESPPDDETPPEEAKTPPSQPPAPKAGKTEKSKLGTAAAAAADVTRAAVAKVKTSGKGGETAAPPSEEGWKVMMESRLGLVEAAILTLQKGATSTPTETPAPPPAKSRKKEATPPAPPPPPPSEVPDESAEEVPGMDDEAELTPQLVMEMSFEELLAVAKDNQVPLGKKETLKSLQEKFLKMLGSEVPEESPEDAAPPAEDEAPPEVAEVGPGVAELSAKIQAGTVTNIKFADGKLGRTVAVYFPDDEEFGPRIFRGEIAKSIGEDAGKFWRKNEGVNELCISFPDDETQAWIPLGAVFDGEHLPKKPTPKTR